MTPGGHSAFSSKVKSGFWNVPGNRNLPA